MSKKKYTHFVAHVQDANSALLIQDLTLVLYSISDLDSSDTWMWHMSAEQLILTIIHAFHLNMNNTTYLMNGEHTMLMYAVDLGVPIVVKTLLDLGAQVNLLQPFTGRTAFSMSLDNIHSDEIITLLIETDQDMSEQDVLFLKDLRDEATSAIHQFKTGLTRWELTGQKWGFASIEDAKRVKKQIKRLLKYHKKHMQ